MIAISSVAWFVVDLGALLASGKWRGGRRARAYEPRRDSWPMKLSGGGGAGGGLCMESHQWTQGAVSRARSTLGSSLVPGSARVNSRVYGIIDNENMYYIPTRLEMHDGLCMGTSVERVCGRGPGPGCRVPTWTEATDSHARSHYARRTHGPRATTRVGLRRYCQVLATIAGRDFDLPE